MRPRTSGLFAEDISAEIGGMFGFLNGVLSKKEWSQKLKIQYLCLCLNMEYFFRSNINMNSYNRSERILSYMNSELNEFDISFKWYYY